MALGFSGSKGGIQSRVALKNKRCIELFKMEIEVYNGHNKLP